jgi:hypothetical protein
MSTRPLDEIRIGPRHRRDMGDIPTLAASIAELGLLHPIVVTPTGELIAGARRLAAARLLGLTEIAARVIDLDAVVKGEFAENAHRKDFTLLEAVAIKRALEPIERAAAKERQGQRTDKHPEKFSTSSNGRASDKVAIVVGKHRTTIAKAEAIVDAAEAEPERFGKLKEDMDRTGRVNGVFRRLKIAKQAELIRTEPPPLPGNGPYRVIVVDPPWPYGPRSEDDPSKRGVRPYPTMSIAQICALPVVSVAHHDCVLWLWTTNQHMREAFSVLDAWDFQQKTTPDLVQGPDGLRRLAARADRALYHGHSWQAGRHAHQSDHAPTRAGAWAFGEAARVLPSCRVALPGTALCRSIRA